MVGVGVEGRNFTKMILHTNKLFQLYYTPLGHLASHGSPLASNAPHSSPPPTTTRFRPMQKPVMRLELAEIVVIMKPTNHMPTACFGICPNVHVRSTKNLPELRVRQFAV